MATPPQPQPQPFPAQVPPQHFPPQQPGFQQQPGNAAQPGFPQQPGFPAQQGFQPQPGFPAAQPGFPAPHPAHAYCRICGGFPAAQVTVRGHQGILIMMRFLTLNGPFCRTCGTAVRREMTGKTLVQGWWSPISLVILTPFTLLWNVFVRFKLNQLQPPVPGQPGTQLDPGLPLFKRPVALGLLIPVLWVAFMAFQAARGS
ncbi:hypothetical protein [Streptomyces sp. NPDC053048]|uniref:hypothetical protein n=1 Tax=Streptomyces sp. NPDC053048 TaxID=3365694 RepID=UPI0037D1B511